MDISEEILSIARRYLTNVRRSGADNIMAICPFHAKADGRPETHPSFAMSLSKGLYFCHACGSKGNLYSFLRSVCSPTEDVQALYGPLITAAGKNIPPSPDPIEPKVVFEVDPLPESLLGVFDYCPVALLKAGFEERTLKRFEVGFDKTHMRITYPLRNLNGHLVGISGRTVTDAWPKYKVYTTEYTQWELPARPEWDRRSVLYNAHTVYPASYFSPNGGDVIVVEGFKACMWVWQAGITNVVALIGTYLSWEHQWMLEHMRGTVYILLDNNEPGQYGAETAAIKLSHTLDVRMMSYPERLRDDDKAQPDNMTPEEIHESKEKAVDYFLWSQT